MHCLPHIILPFANNLHRTSQYKTDFAPLGITLPPNVQLLDFVPLGNGMCFQEGDCLGIAKFLYQEFTFSVSTKSRFRRYASALFS